MLRAELRLTIALSGTFAKNKSKIDLNRGEVADAERLVSAGRVDDDAAFELKLRPTRLAEFIGQTKAKEQLAIALEAAKSRGEALDHVLLFGPPGLGKTTLATIIANELEVGYQQTSGPALQIQGDLTAILTNLREKQVLFLDEIHRLQPVLEEKLYTALEDYKLDIIIGQGPAARTHVMEIRAVYVCGGDDAAGAAELAAADRGLGFCCGWSSIRTTSCGLWWSARRRCWGCRSITMARRRLRCGRGGLRGLRTGCCGGCGTMRRCGRRGEIDRETAMRRWSCWRWMRMGSMSWTGGCCGRLSRSTMAGRWG